MWEPDRNEKDDKEFITFIAQVEGLSAVPDGRIFMNAYIDTVKGEKRARNVNTKMHVSAYVLSDQKTNLGSRCFTDRVFLARLVGMGGALSEHPYSQHG